MSPQKARLVNRLLLSSIFLISWEKADGQAFVADRPCGTLYSEKNLHGHEFKLRDFDQSINLRKDIRASNDGWWKTRSIKVEGNCTMNICSETYMQGNCKSLPGEEHNSSQIISPIQSVNCTCSRSCKCEDIFIPKNSLICGRAYIGDDCNSCDSPYLKLLCAGSASVPLSHRNSVKSVVLRSGCTLELFPAPIFTGTGREVKETVIESFTGSLASYKFICNDSLYDGHRNAYPPSIENDGIFSTVSEMDSLATHPGIKAALESFESGRSHKNAYIVLIGSGWPGDIGLDSCNGNFIGECRLQVRCDYLGLPDPQLRVIYAWVQDDVETNARYAASLEKYLSTHEDLKNSIPNAVVIWHYPINSTSNGNQIPRFQKKLAFVNALRGRLLDEENSNLIVVLSDLHDLPKPARGKPDEIYVKYENAIKTWNFPHPTAIVPFHWDSKRVLPNVNGYMKMENEEYWPMNFQRQLVLVAKRGGDSLGQAIFKAAYPEEKEMSLVLDRVTERLPPTHREVKRYRYILSNDNVSLSSDTDASQLFEQQLQIFPNKALLGVLKIQKENTARMTRQFEIQIRAQSKMLDELKAKHKNDILLNINEMNELRQELTTLKQEITGKRSSGW